MAGLCAQYYGCSVLIFSVADVDVKLNKERVDDSLVEILKPKFGWDLEPEFWSRFSAWDVVKILKGKIGRDLKLKFGRDSEAEFWSTCDMT